jgi:hypothetical protein
MEGFGMPDRGASVGQSTPTNIGGPLQQKCASFLSAPSLDSGEGAGSSYFEMSTPQGVHCAPDEEIFQFVEPSWLSNKVDSGVTESSVLQENTGAWKTPEATVDEAGSPSVLADDLFRAAVDFQQEPIVSGLNEPAWLLEFDPEIVNLVRDVAEFVD